MINNKIRTTIQRLALLLVISILSNACYAEVKGKVIYVFDGDTITILTPAREKIRVRFTEIDAPESKQSFGKQSGQALEKICLGKEATLKHTSTDRYKRTLARVYCDGVDANAEMVKLGMAWVYDRYVTDKSLYKLQRTAKRKRLGLWADKNPMQPWMFRKK
jgi:endonuclease YncB( thermonuclease family)